MSRGVLGGLVALVAMQAVVAAPPAHAFEPSSTQLDGITQHVGRGGFSLGGSSGALPCGTVCDDLWLSEHRPMPQQPPSAQLHRELNALRVRTGVNASWTKMMGVAGKVSLIGGAAYTGWTIGGFARQHWAATEQPELVTGEDDPINAMRFTPAGQSLVGGLLTMPYDGWVALSGDTTWSVVTITETNGSTTDTPSPCQAGGEEPYVPDAGAGWEVQFSSPNEVPTSCGHQTSVYTLLTAPLTFRDPATGDLGAVEDWPATGDAPTTTYPDVNWQTGVGPCATPPGPGCPANEADLRSRVGTELEGHPERYPLLLDWYGHEFEPLDNPDPLVVIRQIPDCTGLSYVACIEALQDAGFGVITTSALSFDEAVPIPEAQAAEAIRTVPAAGVLLDVEEEVVVEHNPVLDDDMPRTVPAPLSASESASGQGESEEEYEDRLVGAPFNFTMSDPNVLSDTTLDPEFGPDSVVGSQPQPGSRAHKGDPIEPRVNPPTAPLVADGGGGCDPWVSPSVNFGPLNGLGVATVFPFAIPFWIFDALEEWVGSPVTPSWDFHFPFAGEGENWHVDLAMFDDYMPAIRAVLLVASLLAMAWFFLSLAMGAPSSRSDSE